MIKVFLTLIVLVLSGCASQTIQEKYDLAQQCQRENTRPKVVGGIVRVENGEVVKEADPDNLCQPLWDAWNEAEERKLRQELWEARFKCPDNQVYWCGDWACRRNTPPKRELRSIELAHSGCVTRDSVSDVLRRYSY